MHIFSHLSTPKKIAAFFSLYSFFSLVFLLLLINITYFFIWYNEQKEASLHDMDMKYSLFSMPNSPMEVEEFKKYLLEKDTIIIPDNGPTVCSAGVEKKVHSNLKEIENAYFYTDETKTYFIFSNYYEKIGEVKVLFDTTPYITSQIIIIKISLVAILFFLIINYFLGKIISQRALLSLKQISQEVQNINLENAVKIKVPKGPKDDEIVILAHGINKALERINFQANNLNQFITDVSHEFKTPLMAMNSSLDLALKKNEKGLLKDTEIVETFNATKSSIKKMNRLLETLFYLAKVDEGITSLHQETINAQEFVEHKIEEVKKVFSHNRIEFQVIGRNDTTYNVQTDLLGIILENLFTNAIKFSNDVGKVKVTFSKNTIEIQDFGIGMNQESLEKLWGKFYKKDTKKEGFGIGLFLVKRICEVCKWKIEVTSKEGKGTKFILHLT